MGPLSSPKARAGSLQQKWSCAAEHASSGVFEAFRRVRCLAHLRDLVQDERVRRLVYDARAGGGHVFACEWEAVQL